MKLSMLLLCIEIIVRKPSEAPPCAIAMPEKKEKWKKKNGRRKMEEET
jgi:hypothetical protein